MTVDTEGTETLTSGSTYMSMAYTWVVGDKLLLQLLPPWPLVVEHMPFHLHHLKRLNSDILATIFLLI